MHHAVRPSSRLVLLCLLASLGLIGSAPSSAQTTGFIPTRPDCMPGVQQAINYIQGPDPILDSAGDINILINAGRCCTGGSWEGVFNLKYPDAGPLGTPRFHPIWATNDFGTISSRGEHEAAFTSAVRYNGKWRFVFVTTFFPAHTDNRDRASRIDLDDLISRALPSDVTNQWILPTNPTCHPLFSCEGPGSGILATANIQPDGSFFVYHPAGPDSFCASGWTRHRIEPDMSLETPAGNGCLTFEGQAQAPSLLSDIARGTDGNLYMITERPFEIRFMEEWVSTEPNIGLHWTRTGRQWVAPLHPLQAKGWTYAVWDGGYLKDENRMIVEPRLVVSQISEGRTFEEIIDSSLGRFQLHYWADAGVSLPPQFGEDAHSCNTYGGGFDSADCNTLSGWAWDQSYPNTPISVDVYDGSTKIANIPANLFRGDLAKAGIGDGVHAFNFPTPASLQDGQSHQVHLKYVDSDISLGDSPRTLVCTGDQPPSASFTASCTNLSCSFDAGASSDDQGIVGYQWNFGDNSTASGVNISHIYAGGGSYTVTLTVTDTTGQTGVSSQPVTVSPPPIPCTPGPTVLCLDSGRFEATVVWDEPGTPLGGTAFARPHPTADNAGFFYFDFNDSRNLEIGVKILDGSAENGYLWVFHGAITTFDYTLTVLDTATDDVRVYSKSGILPCGGADTHAFPASGGASPGGTQGQSSVAPSKLWKPAMEGTSGASGTCTEGSHHFCLLDGRFKVEVLQPDVPGGPPVPQPALSLSDLTGSVHFFSPDNPEIFVKMLDPGPATPWFWVFYGSMTDTDYEVRINDTVMSTARAYLPTGPVCGGVDTLAFPKP